MTAASDRLVLVRDRELRDLIEAVHGAYDLIDFIGNTGGELRAREAEELCATLGKTVAVLCELRGARS
jgi:hypothetical protein